LEFVWDLRFVIWNLNGCSLDGEDIQRNLNGCSLDGEDIQSKSEFDELYKGRITIWVRSLF
jgi:hypothetical protein